MAPPIRGPNIFPETCEKLSIPNAFTILLSPTISRTPVRRAGSSIALQEPFIQDAIKMWYGTIDSTYISANTTMPEITLIRAPAQRILLRSNLSAIKPVKIENTGLGRLFAKKNTPNCKGELVISSSNHPRTSSSI